MALNTHGHTHKRTTHQAPRSRRTQVVCRRAGGAALPHNGDGRRVQIDFGGGMTNVIIAMMIASIKASLVALFFMHLRWEGR